MEAASMPADDEYLRPTEDGREALLQEVGKFYAQLYDRAFDVINQFARENADVNVFNPDLEGWEDFVAHLALETVFHSASNLAEPESAGLKYLFDDDGRIYTNLDDLDHLGIAVLMTEIFPPSYLADHVNRPLPTSEP